MKSSKEFYEILFLLKSHINKEEFIPDDSMFNKQFLKNLILNNSIFTSSLNSLKEKHKVQNEKNNNIFHCIKYSYKKHHREIRVILFSLTTFDLFYNEPKFISTINYSIYRKISDSLISISKDIKLISIVNG